MSAQAARIAMTAPNAPGAPGTPGIPGAPSSAAVDVDVVQRAAEGDEAAWRTLTEVYAGRVFAMVHAQCHNPELAEEITQSVFCTLASRLGQAGYTERGKFEAWLFRIAMNRLRDEMRRQRRQANPTDPGVLTMMDRRSTDEPQDDDGVRSIRERIGRALDQLSEADRTVIDLRHNAGLEFKQIAQILKQPIGTILARHHRALRKLRPLLADLQEGANP
ncbi:MAG: sigma-70 family RNA polymerase sigma factor [Phycisphaeraceae bacterium]|nr:MAG: sigma-70 family RNA polymerase sigma factor [Phycisphaeraceae bacterium]